MSNPSFIRLGLQGTEHIKDPAVRLELEQLVAAIQQWASRVIAVENLPLSDITIDASQIVSGLVAAARGGTGINGGTAVDGDLLIGSGAIPGFVLSGLTAGTGISITNGPGSITIASNTPAPAGSWGPLSDGDTVAPELVWTMDGQTIDVFTPL